MKTLLDILKDWKFWSEIAFLYLYSAIVLFLDLKPYFFLILTIIVIVITMALFIKELVLFKKNKDNLDAILIDKKIKSVFKKVSKKPQDFNIYETIEEEIIPIIKEQIPQKIYKYYKLTEDQEMNQKILNAVETQNVWSSICSGFNDPFECKYVFLNKDKLGKIMGNKIDKVEEVWELATNQIRERVTTICFTQNPNDMSMWAHYANQHRGFCIEYEVFSSANLYPVTYVDDRMEAESLLYEIVDLVTRDIKNKKRWMNLLCYMRFLSTFKDKNWEHEREIRAVFLNLIEEIPDGGKLISCKEVGVKPTKIYIGTMCEKYYEEKLLNIAATLELEYEKCALSNNKSFSVANHC